MSLSQKAQATDCWTAAGVTRCRHVPTVPGTAESALAQCDVPRAGQVVGRPQSRRPGSPGCCCPGMAQRPILPPVETERTSSETDESKAKHKGRHWTIKGTNPALKKPSNIPEIYAKMFGRIH